MALIKISALTTLASAGNTDVFPIVSGAVTYKITKLAFLTQIQAQVDGKLTISNNLSDLTNVGLARTSLGLGSLATQSGTFSGTFSGNSSGTNTGDQNLAPYALLASPAFSGTPTAPTAPVDTNTTQLATTAYVMAQGYQKTAGATIAVASGSLATGDRVVINSDGTVSVVAGVNYSAGASTTSTSASVIGGVHSMYDAVSARVVIVYQRDAGSTGVTDCVIGTVVGSSITFGTPVAVFANFSNSQSICKTGIGSSKVVIASRNQDTSQQGQIIVGTIAGTSITFGSAVAFNAGVATGNISMDYDSNQDKILLAYNSNNTAVNVSVVTVSGTVPTINTPVNIASVNCSNTRVIWTRTANVFVIAYADVTNANGRSAVVTVSGTSSSAGALVTFQAGSVTNAISTAWDTNASRVVIAYQLASNTSGNCIVGTVSGTTISFGSVATFATGTITGIGIAYNSTLFRLQIAFYNGTNGRAIPASVSGSTISFGTAQTTTAGNVTYIDSASFVGSTFFHHTSLKSSVITSQIVDTFFTNLGADNFLGISTASYTNGQTAVITILGGTDANQSGLTAGVKYYVNGDGTLGTTNTQPFVGLGLSATRILVKA